MKEQPLRTTVIGSYPFPGWLEFAVQHLESFGEADRQELMNDAVTVAVQFAKLPDGTNHVATVQVNGVSKQLGVQIQNSAYQPAQ